MFSSKKRSPKGKKCGQSYIEAKKKCLAQGFSNIKSKSKKSNKSDRKKLSPEEVQGIVAGLEKGIRHNSYESLYIVDSETGEVLDYNKGTHNSVGFNRVDLIKGNIVTHNHPTFPGISDNGFSALDIIVSAHYQAKEIRACTKNFDFSMSPKKEKWPHSDEIRSTYKRVESKAFDEITVKINRGEMTVEEANSDYWHIIAGMVAKEMDLNYSRTPTKNSKKDSLKPDAATLAIAKKNLQTLLYRILSRSYKDGITRFASIRPDGMKVTGSFLSKDTPVFFKVDLEKNTVETSLFRRDRMDADKRCKTGLSCKSSCIDKKKTCRLRLGSVASSSELRQVKNLSSLLSEPIPSWRSASPSTPADPFAGKTQRQLRDIAKEKGVFKYSRQKKEELIASIKAVDAGEGERERQQETLTRKAEADRFVKENALSEYAKDWNTARKILKLSKAGGALTLAAAGLYVYGRVRSEREKFVDDYRAGFKEMAVQATAMSEKMPDRPVETQGIVYCVGGYGAEDSDGKAIEKILKERGSAEGAEEADKWLSDENTFYSFSSSSPINTFKGDKYKDNKPGHGYTLGYQRYLESNGIVGNLSDRGIVGTVAGALKGQRNTTPRNQDAINLAAHIHSTIYSERGSETKVAEMDKKALDKEYASFMGEMPPKDIPEKHMRSLVEAIRENKGEGSRYVNYKKPVSIVAHGAGGGIAREALEVLKEMPNGEEIARRVTLITMSSPRMGLTRKIAGAEFNLSSQNDPLHRYQNEQLHRVNDVEDREISSYLKSPTVRDFISQNFGLYTQAKARKEAKREIQKEVDDIMRRIEKERDEELKRQAKEAKASAKANPPTASAAPTSTP